jgi:hydrogenase maturation protein HypF
MGDRTQRWRWQIYGAVQGVGFRPFVYRLARELGLTGAVWNSGSGASVEVEGPAGTLDEFARRLETEKPPASYFAAVERTVLDAAGFREFQIRDSEPPAGKSAVLLPDLATCPECLAEIGTPGERRYGYLFTNCTRCGPRFTIIEAIPYDRPNTTMREFPLCADCEREYRDPADRRFHAQPIACPECGPQLDRTVREVADDVRAGRLVALKGIGGFQLLCDARNAAAVAELRRRKHREEKPFAVMVPAVESAREWADVSEAEERLLRSSAAPIVLLRSRGGLPPEVNGASPWVGVMLPYSPLHHLLLAELGFPVVATSGNLSDEPIATGNQEARQRLGGLADTFATHNRPIARPCDDSVARVLCGRELVMRRARGYAPLPVRVRRMLPRVLAVGAHLKNTIAIGIGRDVFLSQHIGDLETAEAYGAFQRAIDDFFRLYEFRPEVVVCDLHPDYLSTQHAATLGLPVQRVQHHVAHAAACAAENDIFHERHLAVSWDGTGLGLDRTIWGSEFFVGQNGQYQRVAHLRPFRLIGGDRAAKNCRLVAFALLHELGQEPDWPGEPVALWRQMLARGVNTPWTTSMGRLFDAASFLTGAGEHNAFEGQAPMQLEAMADPDERGWYPLPQSGLTLDWAPLVEALRADRASAPVRAARFHESLARAIVEVARDSQCERVVFTGGVFQNARLAERATALLEAGGHRVYRHQRVPPNDGGIALGQAVLAGIGY